jgi:hypothetical protein
MLFSIIHGTSIESSSGGGVGREQYNDKSLGFLFEEIIRF